GHFNNAPVQAEPKPAVELAGTAKLEAGATFKAPTKAGPAAKQAPRAFAKPTPKVKGKPAEAKPAEVKKEPHSVTERAAEVKAPKTPPQADQPGSSSAGPSDD
ncbi:unnamed protein product, partial [Symbiodinium pilosum]